MNSHFRHSILHLDFKPYVVLCSKLFKIISDNKFNENELKINLTYITKKLRWYNPTTKIKKNQSISLTDMKRMIELSLDILQDLEVISSYKTIHDGNYEESHFIISLNNINIDLDFAFKEKGYHPIEGVKQILTKEHLAFYEQRLKIEYQKILDFVRAKSTEITNVILDNFAAELKSEFKYTYEETIGELAEIIPYNDNAFILLWHNDVSEKERQRVIGYIGRSRNNLQSRESIAKDLKNTLKDKWADKETDRGHFMAHSIGGSLDANIFPQRRDINQGKSERGKVYRKMEEYCRKNNNTFCFSRPIYFDDSMRPFLLEFGLIKKDGTLWVEVFENV